MKLLSASYVGLDDGLWSKVKVIVLDEQNNRLEGHILFENDGRDIEVEDFADPGYILGHMEDIWDNEEAMAILEIETNKGRVEFGNEMEGRDY